MQMDDSFKKEQLHFAVQQSDLAKVRALISEGSDINAFDETGMTPLHYAAKLENIETAKFLLDSGANPNARQEDSIGNSPLREVAGSCSLKMAELLINAGADPQLPGWMGLTALDVARRRKRGDGSRVFELLQRSNR